MRAPAASSQRQNLFNGSLVERHHQNDNFNKCKTITPRSGNESKRHRLVRLLILSQDLSVGLIAAVTVTFGCVMS